MESKKAGKLAVSDATETRPSLRLVGTFQPTPLVCMEYEECIHKALNYCNVMESAMNLYRYVRAIYTRSHFIVIDVYFILIKFCYLISMS